MPSGPGLADRALLLALLEQQGGFQPQQRVTRPSRRPRRRTPALYRLRVDLDGSKPPIWRRLELVSDLRLDEVHEALMCAFEWHGHHLHEFRMAGDPRTAERFVPDEDLDDGTPETTVRLDQLLAKAGDRLHYMYDFGDDWSHTLRLEEILAYDASRPRARVVGGRRAAPPDDCGGIYGYDALLATIADSTHPQHDEMTEWFAQFVDDPSTFDPSTVDLAALDEEMRELFD